MNTTPTGRALISGVKWHNYMRRYLPNNISATQPGLNSAYVNWITRIDWVTKLEKHVTHLHTYIEEKHSMGLLSHRMLSDNECMTRFDTNGGFYTRVLTPWLRSYVDRWKTQVRVEVRGEYGRHCAAVSCRVYQHSRRPDSQIIERKQQGKIPSGAVVQVRIRVSPRTFNKGRLYFVGRPRKGQRSYAQNCNTGRARCAEERGRRFEGDIARHRKNSVRRRSRESTTPPAHK